nr:MAG TPA: hypothetical protein [Caudoviricetes sp.]
MINIKTAINVVGLAILGAVGIIVGRLSERKVIDSQLADIKNNIEWQDGQIQMLKDVYTEDILDKE